MGPKKTPARKCIEFSFALLFWAMCLSQIIFGYREDYPFSFFGMYRGKNLHQVYKVDIQIVGARPRDFYPCVKESRFKLRNDLYSEVFSRNRSVTKVNITQKNPLKGDVLEYKEQRILSIVKNYLEFAEFWKLCKIARKEKIVVTAMGWDKLHYRNYENPDFKQTVISKTVAQIHNELKNSH